MSLRSDRDASTTVWLCRHAETASPHVFHGAESDVELGEHGKRQAIAAAEWFWEQRPTVVISSGMKRAVDSARVIAERCGIAHHVEPDLHERRVGDLGGMSYALAEGPWVETVRRWSQGEIDYTTPGAESYADLVTRLVPAFDRAIAPFPNGRAVIIAHGIVCKILLLTHLEGWGPRKWGELGNVSNFAVSELTRKTGGIWQVRQRPFLPPPVHDVDLNRHVSFS